MSDQSKKRNDEAREPEKPSGRPEETAAPGKRLEHGKEKIGLPLTPEQTKKKREKRIMIVMIALAVVMILAVSVVLLIRRWFKKPELPPEPGQSSGVAESKAPHAASSADPSAEPTLDFDAVQPLAGGQRKSEDFYTILIFGSDVASGLTDTIMVASYDVTNQKATVMSIPRDTLINNYYLDGANKAINATFNQNGRGETGTEALKTEISRLVGFVPDYYVTIDWELVGKMVDAIGGVWFDNPYHMEYEDYVQDLYIYQEKGYRKLNGDDAMQVVRWRHNNYGVPDGGDGSDLTRLNVQHAFLKAVLKQTLQPQNIVRIPELIRLFNENVVSDLAVENMLWFGQQAVLGGLSVEDVDFVTMPVYGAGGGRYYGKVCPIANQLLTIINESLNPYVQEVTLRQLDLIQISADGNTLSSTTGMLRNPAAGVYVPPETEEPDPEESDDPEESGEPGESGEPQESDPGVTAPGVTDPGITDPEVTAPGGGDPDPDRTDNPPPATGPSIPVGDGPADGDWGDTPD